MAAGNANFLSHPYKLAFLQEGRRDKDGVLLVTNQDNNEIVRVELPMGGPRTANRSGLGRGTHGGSSFDYYHYYQSAEEEGLPRGEGRGSSWEDSLDRWAPIIKFSFLTSLGVRGWRYEIFHPRRLQSSKNLNI